jgi:hypothetical protein
MTKTEAHTPGQWGSDSEYGTLIRDVAGNAICSVLNPINSTKSQKPVVADLAEIRANARLIAAAPDMLAALQTFVKEYTELVNSGDAGFWDPETEAKVIAARAAIAKAETSL